MLKLGAMIAGAAAAWVALAPEMSLAASLWGAGAIAAALFVLVRTRAHEGRLHAPLHDLSLALAHAPSALARLARAATSPRAAAPGLIILRRSGNLDEQTTFARRITIGTDLVALAADESRILAHAREETTLPAATIARLEAQTEPQEAGR